MPAHPHLGYVNPVTGHDFADPGVFYDHPSQTWYAYGTNGNGKNIQCSYTKDFCSWSHHDQDVLPGPLPAYQSGAESFLWAPEVIEAPQGRGGYLLYVSCQDAHYKKQCIGVAYSDRSPLGPFRWITDRPLISRGEHGGTLDPQPFEDPNSGKRYLVYKTDWDKMYTQHPQLWLSELAPDGLSLVGDMQPLQAPKHHYQHGLLEAPYLFYHQPSNSYVLFFSSGTFSKDTYATSYAISHSGIFGPYECPSHPFLETDKARQIMGPGGACVVRGVENEHFIVFHALEREEGDRKMCVQRIEFAQDGTPHLSARPNCGKRLRLGAEQEDDHHHFGNQPPVGGASGGGGKMGKFLNKVKDKLDS
ncbi:Glycoside hydrolase, family 43 [Kalmanozyma brasiliensis GHG001]|uniref:Arabinanase/levansucrase/invertase n=1 Tax=Kalmanozyma brasiliensis (strain GHG001) TaxID=1365824 RepID=V5GTN0_KALBG|nr:Glycoside hydrolase, family 43 [Kalmanozyma brasiliensis GHG001]EST09272.1 Glycoside hydrolase, family 43 [Kalmanozyma brasiliensis GHG001]